MWTFLIIAGGSIALLMAAELYLRLGLGLGDPPLWRTDPDYEYILKPGQRCRRFGNDIVINSWSMRSREAEQSKSDPKEFRVLVLGDSVVNGVPGIGQDALCTTILEQRLRETLQRPVWVGNISAGSWGPPNLLAYVKRHGLFDCDAAILVINSSDYFKELQFRELDPSRPSRKPPLALWEIFSKYVRRGVRRTLRARQRQVRQAARTGAQSDAAMRELIPMIQNAAAALIVMQHLERREATSRQPDRGYAEFGDIVRSFGVEPINLGPAFERALAAGENPYRDEIHPGERGHSILAEQMHRAVMDAMNRLGPPPQAR